MSGASGAPEKLAPPLGARSYSQPGFCSFCLTSVWAPTPLRTAKGEPCCLLQKQQCHLPRGPPGDREAACMRGPAHALLLDPPHAEGDPAASADGREYTAQTGQWGGAGDGPQLPWSHLAAVTAVLAVLTWSQHHCCCP